MHDYEKNIILTIKKKVDIKSSNTYTYTHISKLIEMIESYIEFYCCETTRKQELFDDKLNQFNFYTYYVFYF